LASGQGSNLAHIHNEIVRGALDSVELSLIISNNSTSGAMEYARKHEIACQHVSLTRFGNDVNAFETALMDALREKAIDLIALAGYMKKLPDAVVNAYEYRIVNVHPALLPLFGGASMYGLRVHEAVLASGCKVSGATVHLVTNDYDAGPILLQQCCEVRGEDTAETLQRRVQQIEYKIFPQGIDLLARDKVKVENGRAIVLN
jgi:phosphoribosylglycinamide formyltransferase-1